MTTKEYVGHLREQNARLPWILLDALVAWEQGLEIWASDPGNDKSERTKSDLDLIKGLIEEVIAK